MNTNVIEEAFAALNRIDRQTVNEGIFNSKEEKAAKKADTTDATGKFTVLFIGYDGPKYISEAGVVGGSLKNAIRFKTAEEAEKFASNNGKDESWKDSYVVIDLSKVNESKTCPDCGKEICECDKQPVQESTYEDIINSIVNENISPKELDDEAAAAEDIVEIPVSRTARPEFFADDVEDTTEANENTIYKYYTNRRTPREDLMITNIYVPASVKEEIDEHEDGDYSIIEKFGFKLANGDFIYMDAAQQGGAVYVKCRDYNSMRDHVINHDTLLAQNGDIIEKLERPVISRKVDEPAAESEEVEESVEDSSSRTEDVCDSLASSDEN